MRSKPKRPNNLQYCKIGKEGKHPRKLTQKLVPKFLQPIEWSFLSFWFPFLQSALSSPSSSSFFHFGISLFGPNSFFLCFPPILFDLFTFYFPFSPFVLRAILANSKSPSFSVPTLSVICTNIRVAATKIPCPAGPFLGLGLLHRPIFITRNYQNWPNFVVGPEKFNYLC